MAAPQHRPWRIVHSEASTGWGGQEHRVLAELAGFQQRGSAVWLLAPSRAKVFSRAQAAKVPVVPLDAPKWMFPFTALRLASWLRRERVEIVNTHSSRDGWLVGVASRLAKTPLLIRSRHIDVDYPNRWLSRHAFTTFADHVLTTSSRITEHFQEMFRLPADRITTLPTGIDLARFTPDGPKAELPASVPPGGPRIGMISVLRSWKGYETFVGAAKILRDEKFPAHFVIAGEGPIQSWIEGWLERDGLQANVTLLGHREDVPAVLRALDVLVIPSTKHEGVPQIGLQAMAVRTPVIGSDVGGIPDIVRPGETGRLFAAGDAKQLAARIRETLGNKAETAALAGQALAKVRAEHSLEVMLDKLDALYERHLGTAR
ncbi:MAG: glycosyltransferase family 4 protein [Verrucomicrobia bacterium]|nr:glycosyltransferase family 4 protein [Verrucomicrobiota bacterium]